jgi:hypothetical protein
MRATECHLYLMLVKRVIGDQDARALECQSRCVMIAGHGHHARSADLA